MEWNEWQKHQCKGENKDVNDTKGFFFLIWSISFLLKLFLEPLTTKGHNSYSLTIVKIVDFPPTLYCWGSRKKSIFLVSSHLNMETWRAPEIMTLNSSSTIHASTELNLLSIFHRNIQSAIKPLKEMVFYFFVLCKLSNYEKKCGFVGKRKENIIGRLPEIVCLNDRQRQPV